MQGRIEQIILKVRYYTIAYVDGKKGIFSKSFSQSLSHIFDCFWENQSVGEKSFIAYLRK